jgi:hypothetical protein
MVELAVGTRITCQNNNHFICEVIDTIKQGDEHWAKKLGNWQMPEPERYSQPVCYICGSKFWTGYTSILLHVENDGWVSNGGTIKYISEEPPKEITSTPRSAIEYIIDCFKGK